jgi:uncharacterized iron-regulated membrane protein
MKYIKIMRNVHLWIGLVLSPFILIVTLTGLIQAEPWIIGVEKSQLHQRFNEFNLFILTNMIHEGIIGTTDFRWIIDITAIGIIVLTFTGIYLSIPLIKNKKRGYFTR